MAKITTNKITLLLLLALCLGYSSTLYGAQNDVDDEKEAYPADNDAYNKAKSNEIRIIKRPTNHFQPLQKGRPPGGSSTDIQYFKEVKSGGLWIGKCNINAFLGANNDEEYREALGLAIYRFFGIITPEFAVSVQPVAPSVKSMLPHGTPVPVGNQVYYVNVNRPCIHIMTQFLEGFSTCGDAFKEDQKAAAITDNDSPFMRAYKRAAKAKQDFHLAKNGKKYPLKGLGTMLALANFIYDMDCIGKSGGNLGYLIKGNHAQVVKIDPGCAFSFLENHTNKKFHHNPMDRKTFFGTDESATLGYGQLTPDDQQAFAAMAKRILKTPRKTLKQLIYSVVVKGGWQQQMADQLLDHLLARKFLFLAAFAPEIDDNLRQEITDAKHRLVGTLVRQKDHQKQSKAQIAAYQKALAAVRAWEAKVAANRLIKQKDPKNNQAQKPVVGELFQLPSRERGTLFTGRKKELASMAAFFGKKHKQICALQVITGVGGMGKTYLALHYAYACVDGAQWVPHRYDAILWFYAEAGLESQFHELAKAWGKKDCKNTEEAVEFVYMALQTKNCTLLVFDNTAQSQEMAPYLPPKHQKGLLDILITTRNPALNFPHYGQPTYITLAAFTKEEARTYTQKILGHKGHSQQAMDALWEVVSGLPLALNHALQYIAEGKSTLVEYPKRFAVHQLRRGAQLQESPVVTSVMLSVLTLREEHPVIEPLLGMAAYLAPEKIPTSAVFTMLAVFTILGDNITQQTKEQVLDVLQKYGLLTLAANKETFDFHHLVQQVLRAWYRSKKGQAGHEALLTLWMAYFEENLEYDDADLDAIHRISPLIPHACAIADAEGTSASIEKDQAELYGHIGYHQLGGVGHYDRAKQCYEKALAIKEQHYGVGHIETASTMNNLGEVLRNLGDYALAKEYYEKALKIKEKHYGADHPSTALTINNLASVLLHLGDYAQAKIFFQKVLKINTQHYGPDHPSTALTMNNLSNVLLNLGDYAQAKIFFQKVLKINTQHYGADHPSTALTMNNLSTVLLNLGDYAHAKTYLQKVLKINTQHYGPDHPSTALTMNNLGMVLQNKGDYAQAKTYLQKALKIMEQHYGADHPSTASSMNNLGEVLRNLGDYAQAKTFFQKVLKIFAQHYGPAHPKTALTMSNLGNVLQNLGDYAQAKIFFQKVLKINTQHYGPDHPSTALTMNNLGTVLLHLGDYAQAKTYLQKALKINTQHYGPDHPSTALTIQNLAGVLTNLGDYAQAKIFFQKVLKINTQHYGADHPSTASTMNNLGAVLLHLGDYAQAKTYYQKALKINTQHYGPDHPTTAITMSNLAGVLSDLRDYAQAKTYYQKALKINTQHYGADHPNTAIIMSNLAGVLSDLGNYAQAKTYYQKALKIMEKHYGASHPETATTMHNLAGVLSDLGDYAQAKTYYQKALIIKEQHYGADHSETATTMHNLAGVLSDLGDYHQAKTYYQKALIIKEQHYGADHSETATTMNNLGIVLLNLGDYAQAKTYYQKALIIKEQHYGADHSETATTMNNLGIVLLNLGDYAQAKTYYQKALKIDEQHYGADHSETATTMNNLGIVLLNLGDYAQAKTYYQKALKIDEQHYGTDHPETATIMGNLGDVLSDLGNYDQAKTYLQKALIIDEQHYGTDHPSTAITMSKLGNVLSNLGDYDQAKTYLQKALKIQEKHYSAPHHRTARTMGRLGVVFDDLGDYAAAKQYLEQALKINTQHYGADHPRTARTMGHLGNLFKNLEQYEKAREYYQQNIKVFTKHYGANHSETKRVKRNLAILNDTNDNEQDKDVAQPYTLVGDGDISLDVLAAHFKNNPTSTAWLQYMHENECDTDVLLYTVQDKDDNNILYDGFKGDKNILLEVTNFIEKQAKAKPEAEKNKKQSKSALDNPPIPPTDNPNQLYKVHKQTKHASGADEKEHDTEDNKEIASSKQPTSPKIDNTKKQEAALTRETYLFVEAMKAQLAKTPVPAYLGSRKWDANAAASFVGEVLRMCREQQYPYLLSHPENYGIPAPLIPFIKIYIGTHPQLQQLVQRPDFCKSHLEKPLMLGQVDQLRSQCQQHKDKEEENPDDEVFDID